jgi:hypothetical protein
MGPHIMGYLKYGYPSQGHIQQFTASVPQRMHQGLCSHELMMDTLSWSLDIHFKVGLALLLQTGYHFFR